jgi:hypothetical protein
MTKSEEIVLKAVLLNSTDKKKNSEGFVLDGFIDIQGKMLEKGVSMPIGTISNGYKKVSQGKWKRVSKDKGSEPGKLNIASVSVEEARSYVEKEFSKAGKNIDETFPNFNENYMSIQNACKSALDIPRSEMPVITQEQIGDFKKYLSSMDMKTAEGKIAVKYLKPSQSQIWLNKVVESVIKFGVPGKNNSKVLDQVTISSNNGMIADGHHRYGQAMLTNPNLTIASLKVNAPIKKLLKISKSFSDSQNNASRK